MDCSPPGSSAHGILQARILEWVAILPPGELPNPGIRTWSLKSPALAGRFFTTSATWETQVSGPRESLAANSPIIGDKQSPKPSQSQPCLPLATMMAQG